MRIHSVLNITVIGVALSACNQRGQTAADSQAVPIGIQTALMQTPSPVARIGLDKIIGFSDVEYCVPKTEFEKLLRGLLPTGPLGELIEPYKPVFPAAYSNAFGNPGVTKNGDTSNANVAVSGNWKDLAVSDLAVWQTQESDYRGFRITFDAPYATVLRTLNKLGFKLPASGKREAGVELVSYVRLEAKAGKTTLTCSS